MSNITFFPITSFVMGEKRISWEQNRGSMAIRRGLMIRTSGVPIPLTINLQGKRFNLREYVIHTALDSENRVLTPREKDRIIGITKALKTEFPECWKVRGGSDNCRGILRAARIMINLLDRHPMRVRKKEIEDLKRWLEYGRKL